MTKLDVFVPPRPKRWMIRFTSVLNRIMMLQGVPILRNLWPFRLIPGIRPIADVREFDFPQVDLDRLRALCGPGRATFIAPNHPEFFTDWMIDKELLWRAAPMAAAWATHTVVNGLGGLMQKFWLANNLIAQIPGNSEPSQKLSVEWAAKGHGILLHPEGAVGWHNDFVADLKPGAIEMAAEALELGRKSNPAFRAFVVPVVWKLVFLEDAEQGLLSEAAYVEDRLNVEPPRNSASSAGHVFHIYDTLLARDAAKYGVAVPAASLRERREKIATVIEQRLAAAVGAPDKVGRGSLMRLGRRWIRENKASADLAALSKVRALSDDLARIIRLGDFAFEDRRITQEQVAEHLKRLRNDYCTGTIRDSINRLLPQPVAPRRAIIRVAEPIEITDPAVNVEAGVAELRRRLQSALDAINDELASQGAVRHYPNPFRADIPVRAMDGLTAAGP